MKKTIELQKDEFRTVWRNGDKGMINVDVFHKDDADEPLLEWSYPKVAGSSLMGNAAFWLEQAILQTKADNGKS